MEWLLIPGISLIVGGLLIVGAWRWLSWDNFFAVGATLLIGCGIAVFFIGSPINYYISKADSYQMEAYYDNVIAPHIVDEQGDYVVVTGLEPAIWQAGDFTMATYNKSLRNNRYWDGTVWGSMVYKFPDSLKYVRVK